jgi:SAM-dependent MidA family methyltransferase
MKLNDYRQPDEIALSLSQRLQQVICDEISSHGTIPFDRFMELALYAPGLGYYAAGSHKFGASGDFITAPELSPLFSRCLANQCQQILSETGGSILEFGAGSGVMAADILKQLQQLQSLPEKYFILDLSPDLKQRQLETLQARVPELLDRVEWLNQMPKKFDGVVVANEVIDAMPVSVFKTGTDQVFEQYVDCVENNLELTWRPASLQLQQAVENIQRHNGRLPENYLSEVNARVDGWLAGLSECMGQGAVLLIDYGYTAKEYYMAERNMGTLLCHYQHQAHDDPLMLVGLQDITASVDFSDVASKARVQGFSIAGYTTQAHFLMANGIEQMILETSPEDSENFYRVSQAVKRLMMPSEMGERFKVLGLQKNMSSALSGFSVRNFQDRL